MYIDGAWQDVTSYVYGGDRDSVTITRGRASEGTKVDRSTCTFTLNNRDGRWSPRNPTGPYYGKIGRNTPFRIRKTPHSDGYALLPVRGDTMTTPDSAALSITGDMEIQIDFSSLSWSTSMDLASKYTVSGNQCSWALWVNSDLTISFRWSTDGSTTITKTSTASFTQPTNNRIALKVTLDVDNGSAGNDVKFYTASDINSPWTQLGSTVTTAGTTSIFDSTSPLVIGDNTDLTNNGLFGGVYNFSLYSGIGGTLKAGTIFAGEPDEDTTYTDSLGNVWTLSTNVTFVDPGIRFRGEMTEWPQKWDVSGHDVYVPATASGVLRRIGQGASPLKSTMYRGITFLDHQPVAYWPCEDGTEATEIASGLSGGSSMTVSGTPTMSSYDGFKCSASLPLLSQSEWNGFVPDYTSTGDLQTRFLMHVPSGGSVDGQTIMRINTTGDTAKWELDYGTGGTLALRSYDADGFLLSDSGNVTFAVNGELLRVSVELIQSGTDVIWTIVTLQVGQTSGLEFTGTLGLTNVGKISSVTVSPGGGIDDVSIGHISVHNEVTSIFDLSDELNAYRGERAGTRIARLCAEEGIPFRADGNPTDCTQMNYQLPDTLVNLLHECEDTDLGILYEPRDRFGLAYRNRARLYNQDPSLTLDYAAADLSSIEPLDDDSYVTNDVTVTKKNGSSARAVLESGTLSVQLPPNGIGRYDTSIEINILSEIELQQHAGWRLHLGTVDEARYPVLAVDLSRTNFTSNTTLARNAEDLEIGRRVAVSNPPSWLPPDSITQQTQGFTEVLGNFTHTISVNCTPESPWRVAIYDTDRYSSDGSTLNTSATSGDTSLSVSTPSGPLWGHNDGDFNIRVGGEVMTVTAVSGTVSPQTFTVTRSVNGVVKSQTAGTTVELDQPAYYAI
jgi:hypothetical protein